MYAIISFNGFQFIAREGEKLMVPRIKAEVGDTVRIDDILFLKTDNNIWVGEPKIENSYVEAKVLEHLRSKKITVFKFIRRENYRRKKGHRQLLTKIQIIRIVPPQ